MKISTDLPTLTKHDVVVDNSILTAVRCSTRGALRHVLHLTNPVEGIELRLGSDMHLGLATWITTGLDAEKALAAFDESYAPWSEKHVPELDKNGKPNRLRWKPAHRILQGWLKRGEKQGIIKTLAIDPQHVEIPVWAPLGTIENKRKLVANDDTQPRKPFDHPQRPPTVVFVALLDAIGKARTGGGFWSVDHKTSGSMGPWYRERQEDAAQFTGQLWAGKQRGLTLNGIYVNGVDLALLNSSPRTCRDHNQPYAKCALQHRQHQFFPVTRSGHELVAWERTARKITRDYLKLRDGVRDVHDVRELPMEGRFDGQCGRCTFRKFCRTGRQPHAIDEFIVEPWNPLDHAQKRGGVRTDAK